MVVISENVHPRALDFQNQRKVVMLRDVQGLTFVDIARQVRNLTGKRPSSNLLRLLQAIFCVTGPEESFLPKLRPQSVQIDCRDAAVCASVLATNEEARLLYHQVLAD